MAGKMLDRMNQLRERYINTYNDPKYKREFPVSEYSRTRVPYYDKDKKESRYVIFKTKEDCRIQKEIIDSLDEELKDNLTKNQLEDEIDVFLSPYVAKGQEVKKKDLRDWKDQLKTHVQEGIVFYYPIENFQLDQPSLDLSKDVALYKSNSLTKKWDITKDISYEDGQIDHDDVYKYLNTTQTILAVRVFGVRINYIAIRNANEKARLAVDLINFLNKKNDAKCVLLNNVYQQSPANNTYYHNFYLYSVNDEEPRYGIGLASLPVCKLDSDCIKYNFVFNPQGIQEALTIGIKWLGESRLEEDVRVRFIKCMVALESVAEIDPKNSSVSLVEQVSTFVSILLEKDSTKRLNIKSKIKAEYDKRSRIIHGGDCEVTGQDCNFIYEISEKMINKIIDSPRFKNYKGIEEIWQDMWSEMMKIDY